MNELPIQAVLPDIRRQLGERGTAVLVAEPGAGKTTRVPLALLDEPWLAGRSIVMLEPRRLAARTAAAYMAHSLGESVGETVGYRVKMDTRIGPATRIEVVTEGVLTRMLQSDPALEQAGLIIFDEFHERSLHADLGLALCLQTRELLRADLRLLVMSATLDAAPVAELLDAGDVIASKGRVYPVATHYAGRRLDKPLEEETARAVQRALAEENGDILVFLPGAGEIRRTAKLLAGMLKTPNVRVLPLYSQLPQDQQELAIAPAEPGTRKVVLATSIAETSLTIEGVCLVIDSGFSRQSRFSSQTGMSRLETVRVSVAEADQRRGRAGRLGPGVCWRLWTEMEHSALEAKRTPEIASADLAPLALELAAWGVNDPAELRWLAPPPSYAYLQARQLLSLIGALDESGALTTYGRKLTGMALHPRLSHMLLGSLALGLGPTACYLAVLLNERDLIRSGTGSRGMADLRLRLDALAGRHSGTGSLTLQWDEAAVRLVRTEALERMRELGLQDRRVESEGCGCLLALAFPDRVGQARGEGRYLLSNGRGAAFADPAHEPLATAAYVVAAVLDDAGADSRIRLAAPIGASELEKALSDRLSEQAIVEWDSTAKAVRARRRKKLGALVLLDVPLERPDEAMTLHALLDGIVSEGIGLLPWTTAAQRMRQRIAFLARRESGWPDMDDEALAASAAEWLGPWLRDMRSRADLQKLNMVAVLESMLDWDRRQRLDTEAPASIVVPSGSRIAIDYSNPDVPAVAVRLQELFGLTRTPTVAAGRVPLTMELLSPANRPVQVTRDLENFWRETYFEVKKDLKGRYPKHVWPDDPLSAQPTSRAKPRK